MFQDMVDANALLRQRVQNVFWLDRAPGATCATAAELVASAAALVAGPVRLQCSDRALSDEVGPLLHTAGVVLDPHEFAQVLSVVRITTPGVWPEQESGEGAASEGAASEGAASEGAAAAQAATATQGPDTATAAPPAGTGKGTGTATTDPAPAQPGGEKRGKKARSTKRERKKKLPPSTEQLRFGLVPARNYWRYDPSSSLASGLVAKACMKLREACAVTHTELHDGMVCIDLGAAPGSWTQYLAPFVKHV